MEYAGDTPAWIKHKTGKDLDPWQIVEVLEIKQNPLSLVVWPPRFGKTFGMEAVCMEEMATNPYEREMLFAPTKNQAMNALQEHLDWIESSPILSAFIAVRRGKRQISESKYEFKNRSQAECFGINSAFDSENATILRGEEWDDMDVNIWTNRVLARGGRKNLSGLPLRIRLSGTIQYGKGPMYEYDKDPKYKTVTKFDIYDGIHFGIYDEVAIQELRDKLTHDQWLRIYLLKYTDTKNFIWESTLRECLLESIRIGWQGVEYNPTGPKYRPRGMVYIGFDCGHSGTGKVHSVYRLDVIEVIGDTVLWLNGKEWESVTDPTIIKREVCDWWEFYGVSKGYGDGLKANDISDINEMLYNRNLIGNDRHEYPENKPAHWDQWDFAPKWNTGKAKFLWAGMTKVKIENKKLIIPYFDRKDDREIAKMAMRLRQALLNIRQVINNSQYPSLEIVDDSIGDDPFDSINMGIACANDRYEFPVDFSQVGTHKQDMVTSGLRTTILHELVSENMNRGFNDFGIN